MMAQTTDDTFNAVMLLGALVARWQQKRFTRRRKYCDSRMACYWEYIRIRNVPKNDMIVHSGKYSNFCITTTTNHISRKDKIVSAT